MERAIQYTITSANTKCISIYKEEIQMVQLPGIEDLMNYEHGTAPKNYSFTSIFRTIACVGDSLASGEFELIDEEGKNHYYDRFEYSWGQFLARKIGSTVYNFSRGGMTAMEYCKSYARLKDYWNPDLKAQAYIVALGVNDLVNNHQDPGEIDDVDFSDPDKNRETFLGYYAKIIQKYRQIQPDSYFFLMTMPYSAGESEQDARLKRRHAELLYALSERIERVYILDFNRYVPPHDEEFHRKYYMNGHLTPTGYVVTAELVDRYIDCIVRNNPEDFKMVGMIDVPTP